jgi:hypothetical protein
VAAPENTDGVKPRVPRTPAKLKEIAQDIVGGAFFTSDQIRVGDEHLIPSVFIPLIFLDEATTERFMAEHVTLFGAPMSQVLGWAINGYPTFGEVHSFTYDEHMLLRKIIKRLLEVSDAVDAEALAAESDPEPEPEIEPEPEQDNEPDDPVPEEI